MPLVCDMSSNIMTREFDVTKVNNNNNNDRTTRGRTTCFFLSFRRTFRLLQFGVVIACAQKNLGPAGITAIVVREDLLGKPSPLCPQVFDYTLFAQENSLLNTPPTFM